MKRLLHEVHSHTDDIQCLQGGQAPDASVPPVDQGFNIRPMWEPPQGGEGGHQDVLEIMNSYCLTRQDWESIYDLCKFQRVSGRSLWTC